MFVESYLQAASDLIQQYELQQPLHLYLKAYFKQNKKYGSRDRKYIAELVYAYYRLGKQQIDLSVREILLIASFLKSELPILFFEKTKKELATNFTLTLQEKLKWVEENYCISFKVPYLFSNQLTNEDFTLLRYSTPRVFIRIRKNKRDIQQILSKNQIEYIEENDECFSMHANVKLDELLAPADYVIQDIASQQTGHFFEPHAKERWWDCCTASGGKSIMLLDKQPNIQLTVSDVRDSILKSLHHRFSQYNYQSKYVSHSIDLSQPVTQFPSNYFDQIICDVPCSGSGTWARSPEQYYFFTEEKLNEFHSKQLVIASEALQKLKPGGTLYYITCSVFEQENNAIVDQLMQQNCSLASSKLIRETTKGGDSLYIAVIKKDF